MVVPREIVQVMIVYPCKDFNYLFIILMTLMYTAVTLLRFKLSGTTNDSFFHNQSILQSEMFLKMHPKLLHLLPLKDYYRIGKKQKS